MGDFDRETNELQLIPTHPSHSCLEQTHMASQHHVDMGSPPSRSASRGLLLDSPLSKSPFPMLGLACIYCTKDSFPSMEALQLHVQAMHGESLSQ